MNDDEFEFLVHVKGLAAEKRGAYITASASSRRGSRLGVLASNVLDVIQGQEHGGAAVNRWHSLFVAASSRLVP